MKILLLDDETFMLKLISRVLANLGYSEVSSFDNGFAALELFGSPSVPPDLVLLDLNMPGMDGVEFIRHLVERRYTCGPQIFMQHSGVGRIHDVSHPG